MDQFHPQRVFSSIDHGGRYAWDQQPTVGLWNLTRFAESLLTLLDDDQDKAVELAKSELGTFFPQFETAFETGMLAKLGIAKRDSEDGALIADMLRILMNEKLDFTLFFRELSRGNALSPAAYALWQSRTNAPDRALMQANNPIYIPRNHQVEAALKEAEDGNMVRFQHLCKLVKDPFTEQPDMVLFEAAPTPDEEVSQTFCGT